MVALQVSIGALNDLLDAERDAGRTPPKPIPGGQVSAAAARAIWIGAAVLGLLLVVPSGPLTVLIAMAGLAVGYGYDRFAKWTAWSWLPFAIGIPLLPVYAWVGTGAALPPSFLVLVPCAVLAGSALAVANASADLEQDQASGTASVAVSLGLERAWLVHAGLLAVAVAVIVASFITGSAERVVAVVGVAGVLVVVAGAALGAPLGGRRPTPRQRELAWEIEAIGLGIVGTAWLIGTGAV
jgi:4-hydroxybenzoate polyprenyltransferase